MALTEQTRGTSRALGGFVWPLLILAAIAAAFIVIATLPEHSRRELLYHVQDYLPIVMFAPDAVTAAPETFIATASLTLPARLTVPALKFMVPALN